MVDYRINIFGPVDSATWFYAPAAGETPWCAWSPPSRRASGPSSANGTSLLSNITRLEIRIEHVADNTGIDVEGIDNVKLFVLPPASADFDDDNVVDGDDFLIWQRNQGTGTFFNQGDAQQQRHGRRRRPRHLGKPIRRPPPLTAPPIIARPSPRSALCFLLSLLGRWRIVRTHSTRLFLETYASRFDTMPLADGCDQGKYLESERHRDRRAARPRASLAQVALHVLPPSGPPKQSGQHGQHGQVDSLSR